MNRMVLLLAALLAWPTITRAAADAGPAQSATGGNAQVTATLFSHVAVCQAGQPFEAAVLFSIKPDWHIYWQNPGDGGIATRVEFSVPAGYTVSTPRFSVPSTFVMPGDIHNFGYEESALVSVIVTPPAGAREGPEIGAAVDWLACDPKECVPGKAQLDLSVPIGAATKDPVASAIFDKWADRMPREFSELPAAPTGLAQASSKPIAGGNEIEQVEMHNAAVGMPPWDGKFTFTVSWKNAPNVVEWYPNPGENVLVKDVTLTTRGHTTIINFTVDANAHADPKLIPFASVLAYDEDDGRHGVIVHVAPVKAARRGGAATNMIESPSSAASESNPK
jgi:DsbC/DsbD-like thiol-disulfide interchange protein